MLCQYCGSRISDCDKFCTKCGKQTTDNTTTSASAANAPKSHGKKKGIFAVITSALLLAIFLIVGFATNWFGATGPAARIISAVENTLSAESFTVEFEYAANSDWDRDQFHGTVYVAIDYDKRDMAILADLADDDGSAVIAIYNGFYIKNINNSCWAYSVREEIDRFFDAYETGNTKDLSLEDFLERTLEERDYKAIKKIFDLGKLDMCCEDYIKTLNDEDWLEENAGYSVKKEDGMTLYSFTPDVYTFLNASIPEFEQAFVDDDVYDDIERGIDDMRLESKNTDTKIVVGVKDGYLAHFEGEFFGDSKGLINGVCNIEIDFRDIGETKIDTDVLAKMLADAEIY